MRTTLCLCTMLTLGLTNAVHAQRGNYDREEPRVIVYENADFRGGSLALYPGDRIDNLNDARFSNGKLVNDQISSVRVLGGASIMLFDDYDMNGQVLHASEDIRNFARRAQPDSPHMWNDRISSLRVIKEKRGSAEGGIIRENPEEMIRKSYQDVLGRAADPDGLDYYRGLVLDQGWTERMVRRHMQESDEYRHGVVDRMIGRAYQDVLKRDPDPAGLANYRRLIIERDWSDRQLREDLRKSSEYREQTK